MAGPDPYSPAATESPASHQEEAPPAAATPPPHATVGAAYRFFLPLMFMAELMMISHAVIVAFLARMPDPEAVLAAYSISFHFHATLGSPVWALQLVALSYIKDRASIWRLTAFGFQIIAGLAWIWALVGFTSIGDWAFQWLFGARPAVAEVAKLCVLVSFPIIVFSIARSYSYGLLMIKRRTLLVTYGTVIRLIGLAGLLTFLTRSLDGALVGAVALTGCIGIESVYAILVARRFYLALPPSSQPLPTYRELWIFSWPIMLMHTAESGVAFTINTFLGRLARAELAIAAFGVLDSLMRVLLGPLRNLTHTMQTLVHSRRDLRALLKFSAQIALAFSAAMLLFHFPPVRALVLGGAMGIPPDMQAYVTPALTLSFLLALCMTAAAVARGLLIATKRTGAIAASAVMRLTAVGAIGIVAVSLGTENGAVIGLVSLTGAFAVEGLFLGLRLMQMDRAPRRLFEP